VISDEKNVFLYTSSKSVFEKRVRADVRIKSQHDAYCVE
jgi:hypothetical protein